MNRSEILNFLKSNKRLIASRFGVLSIGVFGSVSKNIENQDSDVDVFVELNAPKFDQYISLKIFLEKTFKRPVDLIRKGPHLSQKFIQSIESDLIYV